MVAFFSMLSLLASLISIFMGGLVLLRKPRQKLNRLFCLLCLTVGYWAFIEFQVRIANDFSMADSLVPMLFVWPWTSAIGLHFALVFTGKKRILDLKLIYYFAYAPAFLISIFFLTTHRVHGEPVMESWGWTYRFSDLLVVHLEVLFVAMMAVVAVFLCYGYYRGLTGRIQRKQAGYVTLGLAIPTIAGVLTEALFPQVGIKVPELTTTGFAVGCGGFVAYAILRYSLFVLTPAATAQEIIATMPGGLFLVSPDCTVQTVNGAALKLLGFSEQELVGQPLDKVFTRQWIDENTRFPSFSELGPRSSLLRESEAAIHTNGGEEKQVSVSVTGLSDDRGEHAGTIVIARDITAYKRAEVALKESEQKFRSVAQSAAEAIICTDTSGTIMFWNSGAERVLGHRSSEAVGQHFSIIVPERYSAACKQGFTRVASGGQPKLIGKTVEVTAVGRSGKEFPIDLSLSTWATAEGRFFTAIIHDTSERKRAEEELRRKTALLEAQLNSTIDGILIVDEEGRIVVQNQRCIELWKLPEHIVASIDERLRLDYVKDRVIDPENFTRRVNYLYGHPDEVSRDEIEFVDGSVLDRYSAPIAGGDGKNFGRIWIFRDITDQKMAQSQLLRQSEELLAGNRDLQALNDISSIISSEIELQPLLEKILAKITALDVFRFERKGGVFLLEGERLELVSSLGHTVEFLRHHEDLRVGRCLCGRAALTGKVIVSTDCDADPDHEIRYKGMKPHGHVIVPLKAAQQVMGVLYLYTPAGEKIQKRQISLLESIGNLLGVAIANTRLYEETKRLSLHDPLTGLANRNLMNLVLAKSFAGARRTGRPISLVMLDLDHFKHYNDTYGHASGDRLLEDLSQLLSREIREVDLATRYGGEEFLLILTDTGMEQAVEVAERIRKAVDSTEFFSEKSAQPTHMTVSLGVATYEESVTNPEILVARADTSLYRAKANGRNRVEAWLPHPA